MKKENIKDYALLNHLEVTGLGCPGDDGSDAKPDEGVNVSNADTIALLMELSFGYVKTGNMKFVPGGQFSDFECELWSRMNSINRRNLENMSVKTA